jgi:hypothetical protein
MTHTQVAAERDRAFIAWCELIVAHDQLRHLTDADLTKRFAGLWELPCAIRDEGRTRLHTARDAARARLSLLVEIRSGDNTPIMRGHQAGPPPRWFSTGRIHCIATGTMTTDEPPRHIYTLERRATFVEDLSSGGPCGR